MDWTAQNRPAIQPVCLRSCLQESERTRLDIFIADNGAELEDHLDAEFGARFEK